MKKIVTLSFLLSGVFFLAGCSQQLVSQTRPTTPAPVAQTPAQPVAAQQFSIQLTNETANWNIYKNAAYGFEIKYPQDWKFEEPYPGQKYLNFYPPNTEKSENAHQQMINFSIGNADYYLRSEMDRKKYKLSDGTDVVKFFPTTQASMLNAIIYLKNETYIVNVNGFACKDCREIFDKMLPTLKTLK